MRVTLKCPFTDIYVGGDYKAAYEAGLYGMFLEGDEIEVSKVVQGCPDLGCCEVRVYFTHPVLEELGIEDVSGEIYFCHLDGFPLSKIS